LGRFDEAVRHAEKALDQSPSLWRRMAELRLAEYRSGRPWRDDGTPIADPEARADAAESDADDQGMPSEAPQEP
jgi:hypothetical protein